MGNRVIKISDSDGKTDENLELYRDISLVSERADKRYVIPYPEQTEINGNLYQTGNTILKENLQQMGYWNGTTWVKGMRYAIIGDSVTDLGTGLFYGCQTLLSVTVPESVDWIGTSAFMNCQNLEEIFFNDRTQAEVRAMVNYPWGLTEEQQESVVKTSSFRSRPKIGTYRGFYASKDINVKAVFNSIRNIFSWIPGERILNPEFGSKLRLYLYEGITQANKEQIAAEVRSVCLRWEPRVNIISVRPGNNVLDTEDNIVRLDITFTIPSLSDKQYNYSYIYDRTA